jgi:hypothetical protein
MGECGGGGRWMVVGEGHTYMYVQYTVLYMQKSPSEGFDPSNLRHCGMQGGR